ncbi:hypothetical protein SAMN05216582_1035 [Selenomonas ruminantium]|uniref:Uncharacterized protein n=1 Tax=Selenomonas ruminantium TaxID=971 RepID=A0A1M6RXX4_SELRU|nr:HAD family hydrolase [Selenomonas ruminantium]SHK37198.1 hypothetical protein SAMN05216582_1035 [Selenomonas ruminantium]
MKIGASDYDGTLFRQRTIAAEDVAGVKAWRAAGHKFGVVSGRDYGMLMPQLKYYGIESDYAVCNNGGIICRADGTALWQGEIPHNVLAAMVKEPAVRRSFHFAFSALDKTYLYHEREGSWIMREAQEWNFTIVKIKEEDIMNLPQIHQFCLGFPQASEADEVSAIINEKYGDVVEAYPNGCSVDIVPRGVSKKQGIEMLVQLMHWQEPEVYAIGDETNDLPMLEAFQGFTVDTARKAIQEKARAVYPSVGGMLLANL